MKLVNDEKTIRAIAAMLLDMQERENTNLPLLTEQLKETQRGIDNLLNAIQQGIFTKSTKGRLEELEAAKEELEIKIANEKIAKPKLTEEQILSYLHKFRVLDMSKQSHRQRLIDTFINRIYLYDDKLIITLPTVVMPEWRAMCGWNAWPPCVGVTSCMIRMPSPCRIGRRRPRRIGQLRACCNEIL